MSSHRAAPALICAAINGARRTKADHPALPMTVPEIAGAVAGCAEAGAAMAHIHVRDGSGAHVLDAGLYREALAEIARVSPDIVVQITTESAGRYGTGAQIALARSMRAEVAAISIAWREIVRDGEAPARALLADLAEAGVATQLIVYEPDDIAALNAEIMRPDWPWRETDMLIVLGSYAGKPGSVAELRAKLAHLKSARVRPAMCAFGPDEHACVVAMLAAGGDARVGFENNLVLPDGTMAPDNASLVRLAADAAIASGRGVMTADAFRLSRSPD